MQQKHFLTTFKTSQEFEPFLVSGTSSIIACINGILIWQLPSSMKDLSQVHYLQGLWLIDLSLIHFINVIYAAHLMSVSPFLLLNFLISFKTYSTFWFHSKHMVIDYYQSSRLDITLLWKHFSSHLPLFLLERLYLSSQFQKMRKWDNVVELITVVYLLRLLVDPLSSNVHSILGLLVIAH